MVSPSRLGSLNAAVAHLTPVSHSVMLGVRCLPLPGGTNSRGLVGSGLLDAVASWGRLHIISGGWPPSGISRQFERFRSSSMSARNPLLVPLEKDLTEDLGGSGGQCDAANIRDSHFVRFCPQAAAVLSTAVSLVSLDDGFKLITFESKEGRTAVGILHGDDLWPLQEVLTSSGDTVIPHCNDMTDVIQNWGDIKDRLDVVGKCSQQVSEVKVLAPIPSPRGVIMCIGKNYVDHVKEMDTWISAPSITTPDAPKHPIVFTKAPQSVVGPGAAIKYPHGVSSQVDYEAELAVIIGRSGHNISREEAMSHVFGYTILNDVTARDLQKRHQQWFLGKSCDTFCPMGPSIAPASTVNGLDLRIQCWINDELRQDGRTSQMIFSIPELIETISAGITLQPGDIIATGTPAGVGSGFNPPRHLVPGDKIRIRIEGIGELNNTVA